MHLETKLSRDLGRKSLLLKKKNVLHYCNLLLGMRQSHNFIAGSICPCSLDLRRCNKNAISKYKFLLQQNSSDNFTWYIKSVIITIFIATKSHKVKKRMSDSLCADDVLKFQEGCILNMYCVQRHVPILHIHNIWPFLRCFPPQEFKHSFVSKLAFI